MYISPCPSNLDLACHFKPSPLYFFVFIFFIFEFLLLYWYPTALCESTLNDRLVSPSKFAVLSKLELKLFVTTIGMFATKNWKFGNFLLKSSFSYSASALPLYIADRLPSNLLCPMILNWIFPWVILIDKSIHGLKAILPSNSTFSSVSYLKLLSTLSFFSFFKYWIDGCCL